MRGELGELGIYFFFVFSFGILGQKKKKKKKERRKEKKKYTARAVLSLHFHSHSYSYSQIRSAQANEFRSGSGNQVTHFKQKRVMEHKKAQTLARLQEEDAKLLASMGGGNQR